MSRIDSLSPIIISAPVRRSGTTLIQRLLCSAKDVLIYGETCAHDFDLLLNIYDSKKIMIGSGSSWRDDQLESVLAGEVNDWIPDLLPGIRGYLDNMQASCFQILAFYQSEALKNHRPIWGMKMPEWNAYQLGRLMDMMPMSKLIYLHRNLTDCIKSAKGINMIQSIEDLRSFALNYYTNLKMIRRRFDEERMLLIEFDHLIEDEKSVEQIEKFVSCSAIDRSVLSNKLNNYIDRSRASQPSLGYIEPIALSKEELEIIADLA